MSKHILLDNAYEAWKSAVINHDKIMQGFTTLQFQKAFVSSLHNAIELFLKQLLLNNGDHSVATVRKIKDASDAQLALKYYQAVDLNHFFVSLSTDDLDKFNSIEFGAIIDAHRKIFGQSLGVQTFKEPLKLLQHLRNNETHFYICANNYLSESEFVELHNFMVEFFQIAIECNLFPKAIKCFDDNTYTLCEEEFAMDFNRTKLANFSYIDALKNNILFIDIVNIMKGENEAEYAYYGSNNYELAECIVLNNKQYAESIDDVFTILQLMSQYGIFETHTDVEDIETESGETYQNREYRFDFYL